MHRFQSPGRPIAHALLRRLSLVFALTFTLLGGQSSAAYVGCAQDQITALDKATFHAHELLTKALEDIDAPLPNPNYSKWFGSYTPANGAFVKSSLGNLKAHMTIGVITFHCGCGQLEIDRPTVAAAVHAPQYGINEEPYHVYICAHYYTLGETGLDSRSGIIIHEMTHFDVVNATKDECVGTADCQNLAATDPSKAIRSADNYEYYAESLE